MENISKAQVVGFLNYLASNIGPAKIVSHEDEWSRENDMDERAYELLAAGLRAAASMIDKGRIDDPERGMDYRNYGKV